MIAKFLDKWVVTCKKNKNVTVGVGFVETNYYLRLRSFNVTLFAGCCYPAM